MQDFQPEYVAGHQPPQPGQAREVAPGVHWLRMPMPLALDHINLWLLDDGQAWTVVDCGLDDAPTRAAWEQVGAEVLAGRPVARVVVTHMHPDHVGLAHWLCRRWEAPLLMTQGEYLSARMVSARLEPTGTEATLDHFRRHGAEEAMLQTLAGRGNFYARMVPELPLSYQRLQHGQDVPLGASTWRVIEGSGHSPEHAALWCARHDVLISGDMLLPRISTNVSVFPLEPDADPLGRFLQSLGAFETLPAHTVVLPSHGLPFRGAAGRVRQLRAHHAERLHKVLQACADHGCTAAELIPVLFKRRLDQHQFGFALGEAIAHAHRLWAQGLLRREADATGVLRFRTVAPRAEWEAAAQGAAGVRTPATQHPEGALS